MINFVLLKKEIKHNYKILLVFMGILTLYISIIISMFDPQLGHSLNDMAKSMPQLFAAFNMGNISTTLIEFLANYLYGFLFIVFPFVFIVIMINRLLVKYVENGSMSYILSTPNRKSKIIFTWLFTIMLMLLVLDIYITGLIILVSEIMFGGQLDILNLIIMNVGLYCLWSFMLGICFLSCCALLNTSYSLWVGCGINVLFILIQMISNVSDKVDKLKYLTPFTLFNTGNIILGETIGYVGIGVLFIIAMVMCISGIVIFSKKDLSI